jgi:hypothetical protein
MFEFTNPALWLALALLLASTYLAAAPETAPIIDPDEDNS